ncbi:MAG TPA: hypothetical protein VKV15_14605 [Bryobacteraceae bacterium]|nr:hypothetical protein [Bryobacteraceae bacterium]
MIRADKAEIVWDTDKKVWRVRIQVGEEVIKRAVPNEPPEAGDDDLRAAVVNTAKDEGYEVDAGNVTITKRK